MSNEFTVALFGRFDPLEHRHLKAITEAFKYGDVYVFIKAGDDLNLGLQRAELIQSIKFVERAALFENPARILSTFRITRLGQKHPFKYMGMIDDIYLDEATLQVSKDLNIKIIPNL